MLGEARRPCLPASTPHAAAGFPGDAEPAGRGKKLEDGARAREERRGSLLEGTWSRRESRVKGRSSELATPSRIPLMEWPAAASRDSLKGRKQALDFLDPTAIPGCPGIGVIMFGLVRRIHLFEIHDQTWYPEALREAGLAYLRFAADHFQVGAILPIVEEALERSGEKEILDLCSGAGGAIVAVSHALRDQGRDVSVTMTDIFPSEAERDRIAAAGDTHLHYEMDRVDATQVAADRPGVRTVLNAFHHFRPDGATRILRSAVQNRRPIAIVEVLQRHTINLLGMLLVPLVVPCLVPFLRPFRPVWILFTYLIPVIPLAIMWDALVSSARCYSAEELLALASDADPEGQFEWDVRQLRIPTSPIPAVALVGIPKRADHVGD